MCTLVQGTNKFEVVFESTSQQVRRFQVCLQNGLIPTYRTCTYMCSTGMIRCDIGILDKRRRIEIQTYVLYIIHFLEGYQLERTVEYMTYRNKLKIMYRVHQKQCSKFSNEKSLVFLTVNLLEILHARTYDIHKYIYKVKKNRGGWQP